MFENNSLEEETYEAYYYNPGDICIFTLQGISRFNRIGVMYLLVAFSTQVLHLTFYGMTTLVYKCSTKCNSNFRFMSVNNISNHDSTSHTFKFCHFFMLHF